MRRSYTDRLRSIALLLLAAALPAQAAPKAKPAPAKAVLPAQPAEARLDILYLTQEREPAPPVSIVDSVVAAPGEQGAQLAVEDNNTTGRFTHQRFGLQALRVAQDADLAAAFRQASAGGPRQVVVALPAAQLLALADLPEAADDLLFNVAAPDDALRNEQCRANVVHALPARAMRADALGQYFLAKNWKRWLLVVGPAEADRLLAAAYQRAAKRFGSKIVAQKTWSHDFAARRSAQSEVAVFTQSEDYDVLLVADEAGAFGDYLPYRTWLPRPVAGTHGLVSAAWRPGHEQWGAAQLQNRFRARAGRAMADEDYAAWLAVRAIGEAATRTRSLAFAPIRAYLAGTAFTLAGFKGVPLSLRPWDGQMRQPMLLGDARAVVAVAPAEGMLHPSNALDTLGFDAPETRCRAMAATAAPH